MSKLTLIGMYNFDASLFDGMQLPEGIEKDVLIDTILLRGGEYETLYPDVDFMKLAIAQWSRKWERTLRKWVDLLKLKYEPLYNYDRNENYVDIEEANSSGINHATDDSHGSNSNEGKTSAFDSDTYQPHDLNNGQIENHGENKSDFSNENKRTFKHEARLFGNIGTTKTQEMWLDEANVSIWNVYDHAADIFLQEMIIAIA